MNFPHNVNHEGILTIQHDDSDFSDSIIIGNWCKNGCQIFHKDDAKKVFKEFDVDRERHEDVLEGFEMQCASEIESYADNYDYRVRMIVAKGSDNIDILKNLTKDDDFEVRAILASRNIPEISELLKNDLINDVICALIKNDNEEFNNQYLRHENWYVRYNLAQQGKYNQLKVLMNDEDPTIRHVVASFNNPDILDKLKDDTVESVIVEVASHYNPEILKSIINNERNRNWVIDYATKTLEKGNV